MLYFTTESATIVAIQKHRVLSNLRQMNITVNVKKTGEDISFNWGYSPNLIFESKSFMNVAAPFFGEFWVHDNLEGKEVMFHHTKDNNYCYLTFKN